MLAVERVRLGYNNVYLVEDTSERALIDTGPDYAGADATLLEATAGRFPDAVLVSHGHVDHAGLGRWWQERGVPVAAGSDDRPAMQSPTARAMLEVERLESFVRGCGAPEDVQREARASAARRREWARIAGDAHPPATPPPRWPTGLRYRPFTPDREMQGGERVAAALTALAAPGHTPGNFVFTHAGEGWLFSGDQLLPEITPTPAIQMSSREDGEWRYRSLPAFVGSLRRLASMAFSRAYPGHGEPFDDVAAVLRANLSMVEERSERLVALLRSTGPCSAYGAAAGLYPRAVRRRFWQIVSTVQGQLDLLEEEERVHRDEEGRFLVR
jgi:glyoxylase-like metal-dependent hydrolase (beta-lactamase superfamily II)